MDLHSRTEFADLMERTGMDIPETARLLGISDRTVRRHRDGEGKRIDRLKLEKLREIANARGDRNRSVDFRFIDLFAAPAPLRSATPGPFRSEGGARAEERARRCAFRALRPP